MYRENNTVTLRHRRRRRLLDKDALILMTREAYSSFCTHTIATAVGGGPLAIIIVSRERRRYDLTLRDIPLGSRMQPRWGLTRSIS